MESHSQSSSALDWSGLRWSTAGCVADPGKLVVSTTSIMSTLSPEAILRARRLRPISHWLTRNGGGGGVGGDGGGDGPPDSSSKEPPRLSLGTRRPAPHACSDAAVAGKCAAGVATRAIDYAARRRRRRAIERDILIARTPELRRPRTWLFRLSLSLSLREGKTASSVSRGASRPSLYLHCSDLRRESRERLLPSVVLSTGRHCCRRRRLAAARGTWIAVASLFSYFRASSANMAAGSVNCDEKQLLK